MSLAAAIARTLEDASRVRGVRRDGATGTVWRLDGAGEAVEAARDRVLAHLLAADAGVFVRYEEAPDDPALAPFVAGNPAQGFRVAAGAPVAPLREWLRLGNWFLSYPPRATPPADLTRATAGAVEEFLVANDLVCVVDSFHDDTHWTVGLRVGPAKHHG